jgi:thioredoxin 1
LHIQQWKEMRIFAILRSVLVIVLKITERLLVAIVITSDNIEKEIINSKLPAILDVYASWCGPCMQMGPIFEELSKELSDKYVFGKMNIDEERDLAIQHNVSSIPTFLFFKEGKVVGKEVGYITQDDLKKKMEEHLG